MSTVLLTFDFPDGARISSTTSVEHLMQFGTFRLRINDLYYTVEVPPTGVETSSDRFVVFRGSRWAELWLGSWRGLVGMPFPNSRPFAEFASWTI